MTSEQTPAGFIHRGLIVYAVEYTLATDPVSWLIVWLDRNGNSMHGWVQPAETGKRMASVKPGESLVHHGQEVQVASVRIYRALGQKPGQEVVG